MGALSSWLSAITQGTLSRLQTLAMRHLSTSEGMEKSGVFARTWAIGGTALWIAVLLTFYIFVYYF